MNRRWMCKHVLKLLCTTSETFHGAQPPSCALRQLMHFHPWASWRAPPSLPRWLRKRFVKLRDRNFQEVRLRVDWHLRGAKKLQYIMVGGWV